MNIKVEIYLFDHIDFFPLSPLLYQLLNKVIKDNSSTFTKPDFI